MSEFIVSAVVVVEGCDGCLLGTKRANLCTNAFIILWHEKKTTTNSHRDSEYCLWAISTVHCSVLTVIYLRRT